MVLFYYCYYYIAAYLTLVSSWIVAQYFCKKQSHDVCIIKHLTCFCELRYEHTHELCVVQKYLRVHVCVLKSDVRELYLHVKAINVRIL
jgi:hypothetical protein